MPVVFANVLQPLITVCDKILLFFHDTVGTGWGLAIILLTMTVRVVLLPLTLKQARSMRRLQVLAPEIKRIQEKYKDDKQRQQQEMMRFYQENKVNPLASCLPLAFQFPFFIALYFMLRKDLKVDMCPGIKEYASLQGQSLSHATCSKFADFVSAHPVQAAAHHLPVSVPDPGFLFIPDLTAPATGVALAILIVLYVSSQLASGLLSTATADKNQRMLMLGLPILFVTFVIRFPAGLLVYWITTNMWTIVQQLIVRRHVGPAPALATGKAAPAGAVAVTRGSDGAEAKRGKQTTPAATSSNGASSSGPPPARKKKKRTGRRR